MIKIIKKIFKKIQPFLKNYVFKFKKNIYRKRLKNKNFSIICSNCIGGEIYHLLGEKFLSPTIHMWFEQNDFVKFATNLDYYLKQTLVFIETNEKTPVAKCGDIILHFNHNHNNDEAEYDWNRRKSRINFENLYIIFYDKGLTINEIKQIEKAKCKNIAVLTDKDLPLKYAIKLKPNLKRQYGDFFIDKDHFGIYTYEKQWDFVNWLNSNINI